jgi:hypothetical protein
MASIESLHDREKSLTVHKVKGLLSVEDFISASKICYTENITFNVLWDLTEVDLSKISTDEIMQIVREIRIYAEARAGGRTALVFYTGLGFGFGRMVEAFSEIENIPIDIRSFRSLEKAEEWLGISIASIFGKPEKDTKLGRDTSSDRQMDEVYSDGEFCRSRCKNNKNLTFRES